jgi:hypothetical protein
MQFKHIVDREEAFSIPMLVIFTRRIDHHESASGTA